MLVHPVPGGYRVGSSGKVFKSRRRADARAGAKLVDSFRGDRRLKRRTRAEIARLLRASRRAEARYVRDLRAIMAGVHAGLTDLLHGPRPHQRHDAIKLPRDLDERIAKHMANRVGVAFDRMASTVNENGARVSTLLGISPKATGLQGVVANARAQNIGLMFKAGRRYASQVRQVLEDPENEGLRVEELAAKIADRGNVAQSHAETIARTETTRLNTKLHVHRAKSAGIEKFIWSTSKDDRVRVEHKDLDGQTFRYDDPPEADVDGSPCLPGEAINCRCVPIPDIGGSDEGEAEEASDEPDIAAEE